MPWRCILQKLSPRISFASFRIVVWQFCYYSRDLSELAPQYDDCPASCEFTDDVLCETCPRRELATGFQEVCEEYLDARLGDKWKKYGFDLLYQTVLDTLAFEDEKNLTTVAARCVGILRNERNKLERIDAWNQKQKMKP